jgi:hypothetical protein
MIFILPKSEVFAIVFRWIDMARVQEKGSSGAIGPDEDEGKFFV